MAANIKRGAIPGENVQASAQSVARAAGVGRHSRRRRRRRLAAPLINLLKICVQRRMIEATLRADRHLEWRKEK